MVTGREDNDKVEQCPFSPSSSSSLDPIVEDEFSDNSSEPLTLQVKKPSIVAASIEELRREVGVMVVVVAVRRRLGLVAELTSSGFSDAEMSRLDC